MIRKSHEILQFLSQFLRAHEHENFINFWETILDRKIFNAKFFETEIIDLKKSILLMTRFDMIF